MVTTDINKLHANDCEARGLLDHLAPPSPFTPGVSCALIVGCAALSCHQGPRVLCAAQPLFDTACRDKVDEEAGCYGGMCDKSLLSAF
jgi:hypothetical protein